MKSFVISIIIVFALFNQGSMEGMCFYNANSYYNPIIIASCLVNPLRMVAIVTMSS